MNDAKPVPGQPPGKIAGFGTYGGLTMETTLTPSAQPFLNDHRIDGTPVLPGKCNASGEGTVQGSFYSCPSGLGIVTHTIGSPRQIQMSLHLDF